MTASDSRGRETASEKLRALERENAIVVVSLDQPLHVAGEPAPASVSLRNVLPLIADVVKATERATEYAETGYSDKSGSVLRREVAPALIALRDALEGGDE